MVPRAMVHFSLLHAFSRLFQTFDSIFVYPHLGPQSLAIRKFCCVGGRDRLQHLGFYLVFCILCSPLRELGSSYYYYY